MKTSIYSLTSQDWGHYFEDKGFNPAGLKYWLDGIYRDSSQWSRHVASSTFQALRDHYDFNLPKIVKTLESDDGTIKFQVQLQDHLEVETVLIPFYKRYTVCLSTQVGCGMNCSFCYTGTQGLKRHLSAGEIVGQYILAYSWLQKKLSSVMKPNIVFMGQGEPLHNCQEVKKAIKVFNDSKCLSIGHRQMTLSTVGYLPGIKELSTFPKINLALSLHSPFPNQRNELIPINQKYPLDEVLEELDKVPLLKRQFITYEYLMIKNFNMTDDHVESLSAKLGHRKALMNLIPFNPFPGSKWDRPSIEEIDLFKKKLVQKKLRVMVRGTKGDDILAACGQLKINQMARAYDGG